MRQQDHKLGSGIAGLAHVIRTLNSSILLLALSMLPTVLGAWGQLDVEPSADSLFHLKARREARGSTAKAALATNTSGIPAATGPR